MVQRTAPSPDSVRQNGIQMFATFGSTSLVGPARLFVKTSATC
jgi:hypothetical protein